MTTQQKAQELDPGHDKQALAKMIMALMDHWKLNTEDQLALLGVCAVALALVLVLAGPWLFAMVFGPSWREAGELARALSPYIGAHFVAAPLAVVTMAWGAQRWAFRLHGPARARGRL